MKKVILLMCFCFLFGCEDSKSGKSENKGGIPSAWVKLSITVSQEIVSKVTSNDSCVFVSFYLAGVYRSSDNGDSWTRIDPGHQSVKYSLTSSGNNVVLGFEHNSEDSLFYSSDNGDHWSRINNTPSYKFFSHGLQFVDNYIYAIGEAFHSDAMRVHRSPDIGFNWYSYNTGLPPENENDSYGNFHTNGTNLYMLVGTSSQDYQSKLYKTRNDLSAWSVLDLPDSVFYYIEDNGAAFSVYDDQMLFQGTNGVYFSENAGNNWKLIDSSYNRYLLMEGDFLYRWESNNSTSLLFWSNDQGTIWQEVPDWSTISGQYNDPISVVIRSGYMYVGTESGLYRAKLEYQ